MSMIASVQCIRRIFCRMALADMRASYTIERFRSAIPIVTIAVTMLQCRSARSETSPISGTSSSARRWYWMSWVVMPQAIRAGTSSIRRADRYFLKLIRERMPMPRSIRTCRRSRTPVSTRVRETWDRTRDW